jgi:hypothetical protein
VEENQGWGVAVTQILVFASDAETGTCCSYEYHKQISKMLRANMTK